MSSCFGGNAATKPAALPDNWPNSSAEDLDARPNRIVRVGAEQDFHFNNNFVKTSKYEVYNFLPRFLCEEFNPKQKMANVYFLIVSVLQVIPEISNTFGIPTTLLPLTFVVCVDGIFAILEDMARHRADEAANSSPTRRFNYNTNRFEDCRWLELAVGDFVQVNTRETIPADIVLLACHEKNEPPEGAAYVETKSLDGETNLKLRNAMRNTVGVIRGPNDLVGVKGLITMEHPNKLIESFTGTIELEGIGKEPIQPTNVLLRGCVLRNTDWVIGVVINTGHDTKVMMSNTETPSKSSSLERRSSEEIRRIVALLALVCFVGATGEAIFNDIWISKLWYLKWDPNPGAEWVIKFFYFFLLHATFIPVSLYVSMSVVRFFQAYFMNNDIEMYYDVNDTPMRVRTMTLNEELGQISHIFSDKTGTLTCNIMDFRKCSINGIAYGRGVTEIGKAALMLQGKAVSPQDLEAEEKGKERGVAHVNFYDPNMDEDLRGAHGEPQRQMILQFFQTLAVCHNVIAEKVDGEIKLSASSPDDEALVCAAEYFGFGFRDRQEGFAVVQEAHGMQRYEVLEILDFTSSRKRMSAIVRMPDKRIRILSKGADSIMIPRLRPGQERIVRITEDHMNSYATEGLRCLVVGYNDLTQEEYASWHAQYHAAVTDIAEIEKRKDGKPNKIDDMMHAIEQNLTLVGSTAIEDKLQDGVPKCIAELARAGINIWVLTGDKEETAINISVACNLIKPLEYMDRLVINRSSCPNTDAIKQAFKEEIERYDEEMRAHGKVKERSLVIDGASLINAFESDCQPLLLEYSRKCKAVVACRVSPDQKRQMVLMIKDNVPGVRTLAIGDGANDVAMIQAAHIGVGISGQEGMQAVNSSDYAIAQFRYLQKLLVVHGRWNYRRMCKLICYMFYKNILMSIAQLWFAFVNGFSGQKMYTEAAVQLFNLVFTSLPILMLGVYDMDVPKAAVMRHPELYKPCIDDFFFRPFIFWKWIFNAIIESVAVAMIPLYAMGDGTGPYGQTAGSLWENGAVSFTAIIFIVSIKIVMIQNQWTSVHIFILFLSVFSWFAIAFIITSVPLVDYEWYYVFWRLMPNKNFWLCNALLCVLCNGKDAIVKGWGRNYRPQPHHVVQERNKGFTAGDNRPTEQFMSYDPEDMEPQVALTDIYAKPGDDTD